MKRRILPAASLLLSLALAACGGGSSKFSAERVRILTDARAPVESINDQFERATGIFDRSDSLLLSTVHGTTTHPELPTVELRTDCEKAGCTVRESRTGFTLRPSLDDLGVDTDATADFGLTRHGITLYRTETTNVESYGAWMDHAAFAVQTVTASATAGGREIDFLLRYGIVGGDLSGDRPTGTATWQGLMVGTPATGDRAGHLLQGDATLRYSLDTEMLDATFDGIRDLNRDAAHSTESVQFDDVPVSADGTFRSGETGNRIQGAFYGTDHAETAGILEKSNIIGAFGAKKSQ